MFFAVCKILDSRCCIDFCSKLVLSLPSVLAVLHGPGTFAMSGLQGLDLLPDLFKVDSRKL